MAWNVHGEMPDGGILALTTALEHAEADFTQSFGFSRGGADACTIT
ncbi:MAG: hypothetical protein O3C21_17470 [Verrucomicrobia bacterium]|nr:hypothetical protein [Verrucomicrobiota bacterium]